MNHSSNPSNDCTVTVTRTFDLSFIGLVPALLACTALMVAARDPEGDLLAVVIRLQLQLLDCERFEMFNHLV